MRRADPLARWARQGRPLRCLPNRHFAERGTSLATDITAIPTFYDGVNFKSRMEAQCALLFNKLGWKWEYEKFSLMLPSGITYIPDFWINDRWLLAECRGYHSERGDRQISELSELLAAADGIALRPELNLPNDDGEFYDYLVIGPERAYFSHRPYGGRPFIDTETEAVFHKCHHGVWRLQRSFDMCCAKPCFTNGPVAAMALTVESGKILCNGLPVEDWKG